MGQDCIVKIDNKYCHLDRFYIFRSEFEFEKQYTYKESINKIDKIILYINSIIDEIDKEYYTQWINILKKLVIKYKPNAVIFYDDGNAPDEYYDNKNNKIEIEDIMEI